eukprot:sb/3469188/
MGRVSCQMGELTGTSSVWQDAKKEGNMAIANLESQSIQLKFEELPTKFQVESFKGVSTNLGHVVITQQSNKDTWKWDFSVCELWEWQNPSFNWSPTDDSVWTVSWEEGRRLIVKVNEVVKVNATCDKVPGGITLWQIFDQSESNTAAPSVMFRKPPEKEEDPVGHCIMIGSENTTVNVGQVFNLTCSAGSVVETGQSSINLTCQQSGYFHPNFTENDCSNTTCTQFTISHKHNEFS